MNILVFKTVNEERFDAFLKKIDARRYKFYIVIPDYEIGRFKEQNSNIIYLGTKKKYMDYNSLSSENIIPKIRFHEVWVLSSSFGRRFSYIEAYMAISELKYNKFMYKVIEGDEVMTYDIRKEIFFSYVHNWGIIVVKIYTNFMYLIEKKLKGYKW